MNLLNKYANSPNGNLHILLIYLRWSWTEPNRTWNDLVIFMQIRDRDDCKWCQCLMAIFCTFCFGTRTTLIIITEHISASMEAHRMQMYCQPEFIPLHSAGVCITRNYSRAARSQLLTLFPRTRNRVIADCIIAISPKKSEQTQTVIHMSESTYDRQRCT